jgi:hypothetical protein
VSHVTRNCAKNFLGVLMVTPCNERRRNSFFPESCMISVGWALRVLAVVLFLAAPMLPSAHAAPEALDKQDPLVSYENAFSRVEWKASTTSLNEGALPRHRLLLKSSKKSYPSKEYGKDEVLKDFEDFYGLRRTGVARNPKETRREDHHRLKTYSR